MSGGVDSSVAAALLTEQGYDCVGVTMKLHDGSVGGEQSCGTSSDAADAAAVAARLGMPHQVLDYSEDFEREVMCRFVSAYEHCRTPNPCIDCNRYMKFGRLHEAAAQMNCDKVVTGHYARIVFDGDRWLLKKGKDPTKDQSYVLYFLSQQQLAHTLFPLGELENKETVRKLAVAYGFANADKPDSQDICFVPDGDYAAFIRTFTGKEYPQGDFVDPDGKVLGRHKGLIHYTIGQRKGLGLALPQAGYVTEKRADTNEVVVSPREGLLCNGLQADGLNWIAFDTPPDIFRCMVRTRYQAPEVPCTVTLQQNGSVSVLFDTPQKRPAAGQSVVFYDGDTVLGGGMIL